jgi:hypothetical protein
LKSFNSLYDVFNCHSTLGSFPKTVTLWNSWDSQQGDISQIPKHHGFRKTTLILNRTSMVSAIKYV